MSGGCRISAQCWAATPGFAENFDARTGEGLGDRAYTWTASAHLILARGPRAAQQDLIPWARDGRCAPVDDAPRRGGGCDGADVDSPALARSSRAMH
ncbi:hypothetical protein [Nonomuraea sp. SYSU D8015]|uniref:hypothetical protein n=1 Tax=Nonomuraea sp. SYSU D8015 TaxID=2593644 RepID=UPI0016607DBF|nr:hypothetical protein [Nonomuraea sp. SYSU D8015]